VNESERGSDVRRLLEKRVAPSVALSYRVGIGPKLSHKSDGGGDRAGGKREGMRKKERETTQ